jgi:PIN domain nuclease of toxin-antitoxin system
MIEQVVLDASAILAAILDEPGRDVVMAYEGCSWASCVNVAEVRSKLHDLGHTSEEIDLELGLVGLSVMTFDSQQAIAVGELRGSTRSFGLSLGDRACLALAQKLGTRAVTADRLWLSAQLPIAVEAIR